MRQSLILKRNSKESTAGLSAYRGSLPRGKLNSGSKADFPHSSPAIARCSHAWQTPNHARLTGGHTTMHRRYTSLIAVGILILLVLVTCAIPIVGIVFWPLGAILLLILVPLVFLILRPRR